VKTGSEEKGSEGFLVSHCRGGLSGRVGDWEEGTGHLLSRYAYVPVPPEGFRAGLGTMSNNACEVASERA
jgi:hypothetical protein